LPKLCLLEILHVVNRYKPIRTHMISTSTVQLPIGMGWMYAN